MKKETVRLAVATVLVGVLTFFLGMMSAPLVLVGPLMAVLGTIYFVRISERMHMQWVLASGVISTVSILAVVMLGQPTTGARHVLLIMTALLFSIMLIIYAARWMYGQSDDVNRGGMAQLPETSGDEVEEEAPPRRTIFARKTWG